jgi:hypothetical protein
LTLDGFIRAWHSSRTPDVEIVACTPYDIESQRRRFPSIRWLSDDDATRDEALGSADIYLALGDTPFQIEHGPWTLDYLDRNRERCLSLGIPMVFLGAGCDSRAATEDERARRVIAAAQRIWTRDAFSTELLGRIASPGIVSTGADIANLALASAPVPPLEPETLGLLLGLEPTGVVDMLAIENALADRVPQRTRWLVQETRSFPRTERWNYATLSEWTRSAVELMPMDYAADDIATFANAFGAPETVVTSRYHGALIAAWHGCRVAVIERSGKLAGVSADLGVPISAQIRHRDDLSSLVAAATTVDPAILTTFAHRAQSMCEDFFQTLGRHPRRHQPSSVS